MRIKLILQFKISGEIFENLVYPTAIDLMRAPKARADFALTPKVCLNGNQRGFYLQHLVGNI